MSIVYELSYVNGRVEATNHPHGVTTVYKRTSDGVTLVLVIRYVSVKFA